MNRKRLCALLLTLTMTISLIAVPMAASAANQNLALDGAAIASSVFNANYGIANLNDGITAGANTQRWTTNWSVATEAIDEWCGVEFSTPTQADTIVFYEYDSRITEYKVEYKNADGEWNTVTKDGAALPNQTKEALEGAAPHSVANTVSFDLMEVMGLRIYIVDVGEKAGASLWEFEVYNKSAIDATTNLAVLKGTAIADPEKSVTDPRFLAANLNDGSATGTSRWSSNWNLSAEDVVGCWAGIRFDVPTAFDKMTVKEFNGRVTKFIVEVSNDGENWTPVKQNGQEMPVQEKEYEASCTANLRTYDVTFDRVLATYARFRIVEVGAAGPSLWELEIYDSQGGAPFDETDDEAAFRADVDSVTAESLLGTNADAQNIITNLILPASPLTNGTFVNVSVTEGGDYLAADGTVTRPANGTGDQQATLQIAFSSPNGTYTDSKTFSFTILQREAVPTGQVLLQEDYSIVPAGTDPAVYHWEPYEMLTNNDLTKVEYGTFTMTGDALVMQKTQSGTDYGIGMLKSFQYYERSYAATGTADETRTAVWADKLKGVFDVDMNLKMTSSSAGKANYLDFMGYAPSLSSVGRFKAEVGPTNWMSAYYNGSLHGGKGTLQLYQNTTQEKAIKTRFNTETKTYQVFLDGSDTPVATSTNGATGDLTTFPMTDWSVRSEIRYVDRLKIYLAKEQPQNATIEFSSFSLTQIEGGGDETVDNAVAQLTMDMVCDSPEDVTAIKTLPETLAGADIAWSSSHPQIISDDGVTVNKPNVDTDVILTATVTNPTDGFDKHKEFKLTVKAAEVDNEAAFQADVDSVTANTLLGTNADAQNIVSDLTLPASPLTNGTTVAWSVISGESWIDSTGKVTRPTETDGNQTVQLKAVFTSPQGTYTDEKTFDFTILCAEQEQPEDKAFQEDIAGVTERYLLGANTDAQNVKWDLNLPVSPLPNGTTVTWAVENGTAVSTNGTVTRPAQAEQVTLRASFTKAGAAEAGETRDFTFTVLPEEAAEWKLVENVKVEDPRGASTYAISQITDGISSSTAAEEGVRFGQLTNSEVPSANRPDMRINFSDKIKAGKKYYIEMTVQADMKAGEARVGFLNEAAGEASLFVFSSANTVSLAANDGSGRKWVNLGISHTAGAEETIGIVYDTQTGTYQFVSNRQIVSETAYKNNYGAGIASIQVSYQGKAGDQAAYIITKGLKVYEYDETYQEDDPVKIAFQEDVNSVTADSLLGTNADAQNVISSLRLPTSPLTNGTRVEWSVVSGGSWIDSAGKVTRPTASDGNQTVQIKAAFTSADGSYTQEKTFTFRILAASIPGTTGEKNLALNGAAIASSEYAKSGSDFSKETLIDGVKGFTSSPNNNKMRWTTNYSDRTQNIGEWCGVEFSKPTYIDTIVFYEYDSRITEYTVEYQDAEGEWHTVQLNGADMPNQQKAEQATVNSAHSVANVVSFDLVKAKAIRLVIVDVGQTAGASVWEFEVYCMQEVADSEEEFRADMDSVTAESLLGGNTAVDNITEDLALPASPLLNDTKVEWSVVNGADWINNTGAVTRPTSADGDQTVQLKAVFTSPQGTYTDEKIFTFTIPWYDDPQMKLDDDMALVTYESLTAQDPARLTENLTMPASPLPNGTAVTWTSSDPAVLTAQGEVARPADKNRLVMLTAAFQFEGLSAEKTFQFTVLAEGELLENLAEGARPSTNIVTVEGNVSAVTDGNYETAWATAAENVSLTLDLGSVKPLSQAVIYAAGSSKQNAVLEVSGDNVNYTQIAELDSLEFGSEIHFALTDARYIRLRVTQQGAEPIKLYELEFYFAPTDKERVAADVDAFEYTNPKVITSDIVLPTETKYGSTLEWTSSNTAALDAQGHVTRASQNQDVALTAVFRSGEESASVVVYHTVQGTKAATGPSSGGGGGGSSSGGSASSTGGSGGVSLQVPVIQPENTVQPTPGQTTQRFSDVSGDRWSYPYIEQLAQKNIVEGSGGVFEPEGRITREQLVKMIVVALDMELSTQETPFADVAADAWYSQYIAAAVQAGIVKGISETEFGVGQYVTREDMAAMICRALDGAGAELASGSADVTFTDSEQISEYAREAVQRLALVGILNGENGFFMPQDTATREQGAKVICMVLEKLNQ